MMLFGIRKEICGAVVAVSMVVPSAAFSAWVNATGNLSGMQSECGTLHMISAVPGKDKVIAGVAGKGLWASTNGGASWTQLGTGAGSSAMNHRPTCIVYDPTNSDIFWESGIYGSTFGVYHTTDGGVTLTNLGTIHPCDNVSIDLTDPARKLLLASGHETQQKLYKSIDGGQNWNEIGASLPAGTSFPHPYVINATTWLVGCAGYSGTQGLYRTSDGGTTWTAVGGTLGTQGPTTDPLALPDGTIYWSLIYNRGLIRSTNQGVNWVIPTGYNNVLTGTPIYLPDNRLAGLSPTTNKVVASTTGAVWTGITDALASTYESVVYEPVRGAFYVKRSDCGSTTTVSAAAVMRFDIKITASGVERHIANPAKNRQGQALTAVVAGLRTASIAKGAAYDLQGVAIRSAGQMKTAGVVIVKQAK